MKSKLNKDLIDCRGDNSSTSQVPRHCQNLHSNRPNDSVHNSNSTKSNRKHKRKATLSSQDEDRCEQSQQKFKKARTEKGLSDFDSVIQNDFIEKSDEETSCQDNTPKSLIKKKKTKKGKVTLTNVQPNTSTLDYLKKWKSDRNNWKFEKVKQKRLISNMFNNEKLPDDYFPVFLEYMESGSKSVRELISKLAKDVVDEMEKWETLSDVEKETTAKVNENKYERARTVLQMLQ